MFITHTFLDNIDINISVFVEVTFFCLPGTINDKNVKEVEKSEFMINVLFKLLF